MARAGYCSGCGNYVFLRPDGGCSNGHGPESVSNPYEVPDAPVAPQPAPAYQPPAAPYPQQPPAAYQQPPAYPPPGQPYAPQPGYAAPAAPAAAAAAPKKKRTGLIVTVVLLVLLLCCCGVGVGGVLAGFIPNPLGMLTSPEHQKVQAAGDFFKALLTKNVVQLRRTIPADAANAADPVFWVETLLKDTSPVSTVSEAWSGDVLTLSMTDAEGIRRQVMLKAGEGDRVVATSSEVGKTDSVSDMTIVMKREADGWKVFSLGEGADAFITFDAASIKKLQEEMK